MRTFVRAVAPSLILLAAAGCASSGTTTAAPADAGLAARARAIHERVMALDTHVDIDPGNFLPGQLNYAQRLNTQVDLTKMEEGGLDAVFFSIYVGPRGARCAGFARAYATDTAKFNAVHRLAEQLAPNRIAIAYTADDARRIYASGKKVALMGVENGYGIGTDITRVKEFYDRGARYMSLAHNGHSQLSDSNTGEATNDWMWHGLSPLGKQVIAEMNRLGIMIDISHPSKESMMQAIALTKAPIIASHSGVRALCNVTPQSRRRAAPAIAKNGGVVQMVAFRGYVKCDPAGDAARAQAIAALNRSSGIGASGRGGGGRWRWRRRTRSGRGHAGSVMQRRRAAQRRGAIGRGASIRRWQRCRPTRRAQYQARQRAIDEKYPAPPARR